MIRKLATPKARKETIPFGAAPQVKGRGSWKRLKAADVFILESDDD